MNPDNTLYRQVSFEDGFDLISNGNDDKFIYLKEVHEQEQEKNWQKVSAEIGVCYLDENGSHSRLMDSLKQNFILIKKQ